MKTLIFVLSVISRQYLDHPSFVQILQYFFSCLNPFMITLSSWPSVSTLLQFLNALPPVSILLQFLNALPPVFILLQFLNALPTVSTLLQFLNAPPPVFTLLQFLNALPPVFTLLQFLNALSSVNGSWYSCWWLSLLLHHCRSETTVNELGHSRSPIKRRLRVWVCGDVVSALKPAPLRLAFDLLPWWPNLMTIPGDCYLGDLISWLFLGSYLGDLMTIPGELPWWPHIMTIPGECYLDDLISWLYLESYLDDLQTIP